MTSRPPFLALDLGAASGRAMLGIPGDRSLDVRPVHRFEIHPVPLGGALYWDFLRIWDNIREALRKCAAGGTRALAGIGVDTWNLDFGLVDGTGFLVRDPLSYRSPVCPEDLEQIRGRVREDELYEITGFGYSPITGLARLLQMRRQRGSGFLREAVLLPLPDLLRHFLCGSTDAEETVLWGTQLVDIRTRAASPRLLEIFGVPSSLFPPVTRAGRTTGNLLPEVCQATGIERAPVHAVAGHDTMSAAFAGAAAAAGSAPGSAVLCTGSWFILGKLLPRPLTDPASLAHGFANEIAPRGLTFLARNLAGFFLLEELLRHWRLSDPALGYPALLAEAAEAPAFAVSVNANDPAFFFTTNIARSLEDYFARTGQAVTPPRGALVRGILEGLVLECRRALGDLESLTGEAVRSVIIVGGGARNQLLCRMLADGMQRPLAVGPPEATVLGNIAMQMTATGEIAGQDELEVLMGQSFPVTIEEPRDCDPWRERAERSTQ